MDQVRLSCALWSSAVCWAVQVPLPTATRLFDPHRAGAPSALRLIPLIQRYCRTRSSRLAGSGSGTQPRNSITEGFCLKEGECRFRSQPLERRLADAQTGGDLSLHQSKLQPPFPDMVAQSRDFLRIRGRQRLLSPEGDLAKRQRNGEIVASPATRSLTGS